MATSGRRIHVNGPAHIYADLGLNGPLTPFQGGNGKYDRVGLAVDGVDIILFSHRSDIQDDKHGNILPGERQKMGGHARIIAPVVRYDAEVIAEMISIAQGDIAEGTIGLIGDLTRQRGLWYGLLINSPLNPATSLPMDTVGGVAAAFHFPSVELADEHRVKKGTQKSVWQLVWEGWAWTRKSDGSSTFDINGSAAAAGTFVDVEQLDSPFDTVSGNVLYDHDNSYI